MTSPPTSEGRFAPGTLVAERYRIVALLGRGGMGEVYRADDLKLGVGVAIKFLPERLEADPDLRRRFLDEVRLARQVAHPNVCRMYDIGEVQGRYFLTMEYVDGEDLSVLLRRVGRLTGDRAAEIARQIAAGLAAAHDQGILHRDLKPANVMIDGQGRARITDFGLAGLAAGAADGGGAAGTPAYMAPEQFAGGEATVKSDLYALGLVYYELFTGKPVSDPSTPIELLAFERQSSTPASPSSLVADLPLAVERVIQRCLQSDPALRPSSAIAVAAALPGGDPLAAAIAAGETPSPELLAEAGSREGFSVRGAWLATLAVALLLAVALGLAPRTQLTLRAAPPKPAEVLRDRATTIATRLGWTGPFVDRDGAWSTDDGIVPWIAKTDSTPGRWARLSGRDGQWLLFYWWRQSPRPLQPVNVVRSVSSPFDPPLELPGDVLVTVDAQGRLRRLLAGPPDVTDSTHAPAPAPWGVLFEEAGLDSSAFHTVPARWLPDVFADDCRAWEGRDAGSGLALRVEAAAFHGKIVSLRLIRPWTTGFEALPEKRQAWQQPLQILVLVLIAGLLLAGVYFGVRNLQRGHADWRGALRIGQLFLISTAISVFLARHYMPFDAGLPNRALGLLAAPLMVAALFATFYVSLEPHLRRLFPDLFVSWVRALDFRFGDARVARDVLIGLFAGAGVIALQRVIVLAAAAAHLAGSTPDPSYALSSEAYALNGWRALVVQFCDALGNGMQLTLTLMLITLMASFRIRNRWLTIAIVVLSMLIVRGGQSGTTPFEIVMNLAFVVLVIAALFRLGPLATFALITTSELLRTIPTPLDSGSWYFRGTPFVVLVIAAATFYALRTSLAAQAGAPKPAPPAPTPARSPARG